MTGPNLRAVVGTACLFVLSNFGPANGFSAGGGLAPGRMTHRRRRVSSLSSTDGGGGSPLLSIDVRVEKPMGIVLEENEEDGAAGVFCLECDGESAAFAAGVRPGDAITSLAGTDVTAFTFNQVMEALGAAESPVALTLERAEQQPERKKAVIQPKRMPSAKKLAKATTSVSFWKDPLMIGSVAFTVLFPLGIYLISSGSKPA
eukprot:CAMPEP_0194278876 /NCGR_PEP_ID=MMETSP0169-20130528/12505_1 /TAXON_ID=218684 /ORGANISM="Corethron pennatum, Strain L29A3" /LENGTH=202 /DNA_ID=CAMNT_0039023179 /DNA_START=58 /DNA_END=666 /DNA_ORIENTATION=+